MSAVCVCFSSSFSHYRRCFSMLGHTENLWYRYESYNSRHASEILSWFALFSFYGSLFPQQDLKRKGNYLTVLTILPKFWEKQKTKYRIARHNLRIALYLTILTLYFTILPLLFCSSSHEHNYNVWINYLRKVMRCRLQLVKCVCYGSLGKLRIISELERHYNWASDICARGRKMEKLLRFCFKHREEDESSSALLDDCFFQSEETFSVCTISFENWSMFITVCV